MNTELNERLRAIVPSLEERLSKKALARKAAAFKGMGRMKGKPAVKLQTGQKCVQCGKPLKGWGIPAKEVLGPKAKGHVCADCYEYETTYPESVNESGPVEHAAIEKEIRSVLDRLTKARERAEKYRDSSVEGSGKQRLSRAIKHMVKSSQELSSAAAFW